MRGSRTSGLRGRAALLLGAVILVGVGAVTVGTGFADSRSAAAGGATAAGQSTPQCAAIQQQLQRGGQVDPAQAIQCDQQEFQALEVARQQARAQGQNPAMRLSPTCQVVNGLATRSRSVDFNLAFHCRQRERFANQVNLQNGNLRQKQLTSLCKGVLDRVARGEPVDRFQQTFCQQEQRQVQGG